MIVLDTDHINVLQSQGPQAITLSANMATSADQDFATTAITIEEQPIYRGDRPCEAVLVM